MERVSTRHQADTDEQLCAFIGSGGMPAMFHHKQMSCIKVDQALVMKSSDARLIGRERIPAYKSTGSHCRSELTKRIFGALKLLGEKFAHF